MLGQDSSHQLELPVDMTAAAGFVVDMLGAGRRPSPAELVADVRRQLGAEDAWLLPSVVAGLAHSRQLTADGRAYCRSLVERHGLMEALRDLNTVATEITSTIDALVRQSRHHRRSAAFREMVEFMGRFKRYSAYNNMLVKWQNPSCGHYATQKDWEREFGRQLKDDARPMVILAPKHPVLLVFDLDQTTGPELPQEIREFAQFKGEFSASWMTTTLANADRYGIDVAFRWLSSTHGGFATSARGTGSAKMRVVVHAGLDQPSRLGVLAHELAHVLLGHLGGDNDLWWPARAGLDRAAMEIEAEAVAHIVTRRLGLTGSSAAYVCSYLDGDEIPATVSIDLIAKTAGLVERMAREELHAPKRKAETSPKPRRRH